MIGAPPRLRSALYVPGYRPEYLAKADRRGADGLIIDLEDSVADTGRDLALDLTARWIAGRPAGSTPAICVRINAIDCGRLDQELAAIVHPNLTAVVVPKIESPAEVRVVEGALAYAEGRAGVPYGRTRIWPLVETAAAVADAGIIARSSARIAYMGGGSTEGGDLARAIGLRWTPEATETLYIRSKVLVDVRAARVPNPMTGIVSTLDRLDEVESFAVQSRHLGYEGMMVIHPSHVPIVNRVFTPTESERREAAEIISALDGAAVTGSAAVSYKGRMIDAAMIRTAEQLLGGATEG